jgi:hypothetical protein
MNPSDHLQQLFRDHYRTNYPAVPEHCMPKQKYTDKTANGLTRMVLDFVRFSGGYAERINVMGRVIKTKANREIYIPSSGSKGSADISAILPGGKSARIEIKIGKDKQSDKQRQYADKVNAAGGIYVVIRSFQDFYSWYQTLTNGTTPTN